MGSGIRRAQTCFVLVISLTLLSLLSFLILTDVLPPQFIQWPYPPRTNTKLIRNYFLDVEGQEGAGLIVNTSNCQIPNFSPFDPAMSPFITVAEPTQNCSTTSYSWTYMDGKELVIRASRMKEDGYIFESGQCCYKKIHRVTQSQTNYDENADNEISSSDCIPISKIRTEIEAEFVTVECYATKFLNGFDVVYRGYHSRAYPQASIRLLTKTKLLHWENIKSKSHLLNLTSNISNSIVHKPLPPNILVLGIDSTSRLNFRRNMFKTLKILEQELEATEILGYTKVGENTFPNFCALFQGYSNKDVERVCFNSSRSKLDECPFLWKRLDAANYLTGHSEDAPSFTGFNYGRTGFVEQPVDFYLRTLFLAAHQNSRSDHLDCIGHKTNDEVIVDYVSSIMDLSAEAEVPVFSFSWSTTLPHNNPNSIQLVDETYATLLRRLIDKGRLENTILIFMGDHGYRFGDWRETLIGYYEDKLPNLWIGLPNRIREKFPHWLQALKINSKRLTSPFTLHWTLNQILDTFTDTSPLEDSKDRQTGQVITRKHRQSLFELVPEENRCEDVGVPDVYCACYPLQKVNLEERNLFDAANAATKFINKGLSSICAPLQVSKITAGALMDKSTGQSRIRYIVGFITVPGDFVIEAEIDFFPQQQNFSEDVNVQRANRINPKHVKCLPDNKLELFCYCLS